MRVFRRPFTSEAPGDGPVRPPFAAELLFDVMAEAASVLHGPVDLDAKCAWTVNAVALVTGAPVVAYVEFGDGGPSPRAGYGLSLAGVRRVLERDAKAVLDEVALTAQPAQRRIVVNGEASTVVATPVREADGAVFGALLAVVDPPDPPEPVAWVAEGLGGHLGAALANERQVRGLIEREAAQREVVTHLQEALQLPAPDTIADLGVYFLAADPGVPTGGDLHDWVRLPDGDVYLAVIDVVGKGVPATKDAVAVLHALRLLVVEGWPFERVVARADDLLTDGRLDFAATLAIGRYTPATGRLLLAGAGCPPVMLLSVDGRVELVDVPGVPIGWPGAGSARVVEVTLEREQAVVLYTDGLIETTRDILEGLDRLVASARAIARYPARQLARALVERAVADAMRRDDALALVLRHRIATPPSGPVIGPFRYRFTPTTAAVPLVRHQLADWLALQPVEPAHHADILFVATELCANAVMAARPRGTVELRARLDEDAVELEVEDDGGGFDLDIPHERPDPDTETGRGLFLVAALTDDLSVRREHHRTVIRAVRRAVTRDDRSVT
jgi:anti-sigma regulatory factor (Ser/Thr protein kinase)